MEHNISWAGIGQVPTPHAGEFLDPLNWYEWQPCGWSALRGSAVNDVRAHNFYHYFFISIFSVFPLLSSVVFVFHRRSALSKKKTYSAKVDRSALKPRGEPLRDPVGYWGPWRPFWFLYLICYCFNFNHILRDDL